VRTSPSTTGQREQDVLRTTSSKSLTPPLFLKTSYRRGIWMSHRTLSLKSSFLMTHLASLSHSFVFLRRRRVSRVQGGSAGGWKRDAPAVDADPVLGHLVLARLQVGEDLLGHLGEVAAIDVAARSVSQCAIRGREVREGRTCRS